MIPQLSGGCLCRAVRYVLTQRVRFNPMPATVRTANAGQVAPSQYS